MTMQTPALIDLSSDSLSLPIQEGNGYPRKLFKKFRIDFYSGYNHYYNRFDMSQSQNRSEKIYNEAEGIQAKRGRRLHSISNRKYKTDGNCYFYFDKKEIKLNEGNPDECHLWKNLMNMKIREIFKKSNKDKEQLMMHNATIVNSQMSENCSFFESKEVRKEKENVDSTTVKKPKRQRKIGKIMSKRRAKVQKRRAEIDISEEEFQSIQENTEEILRITIPSFEMQSDSETTLKKQKKTQSKKKTIFHQNKKQSKLQPRRLYTVQMSCNNEEEPQKTNKSEEIFYSDVTFSDKVEAIEEQQLSFLIPDIDVKQEVKEEYTQQLMNISLASNEESSFYTRVLNCLEAQ